MLSSDRMSFFMWICFKLVISQITCLFTEGICSTWLIFTHRQWPDRRIILPLICFPLWALRWIKPGIIRCFLLSVISVKEWKAYLTRTFFWVNPGEPDLILFVIYLFHSFWSYVDFSSYFLCFLSKCNSIKNLLLWFNRPHYVFVATVRLISLKSISFISDNRVK